MASPTEPSHQQQVSSLRQQLDEALARAPSNSFSPAWRQVLDELRVTDLLGETLQATIREIFERNEITPSAAAEELTRISERLQAFSAALDQVLAGVEWFGIGAEELAPGQFEVGFLIPRDAVDNELEQLGEELVELDHILGPFQELATGTRPDLEVRMISSSGFQVFLASTPALALCFAKAVESLITSYEKIVNIRLGHQQLKADGVPDEALKGIAEYARGAMKGAVGELVEELLAEFGEGVEEGRKNELRKDLRRSLTAIANRIDGGYDIEVRTGELPEDDEEMPDGVTEDTAQVARVIAARQRGMRFMNLTGKPILELPEADDEDTSENDNPA